MILEPHSRTIPIPVFCVEQHRWSARSGDSGAEFGSSNALLPSLAAKMAMRATATDTAPLGRNTVFAQKEKIWQSVTAIQGKLSSGIGVPVAAPTSQSSLQLVPENKELDRDQVAFIKSLQQYGVQDNDIVGYVVAINGRLNSAEIDPSNRLFRKMWPLLLRANATEDRSGVRASLPTVAAVMYFLDGAGHAHGVDRTAADAAMVNVRQSNKAMMFEARPATAVPATAWISRSYLAR
jgi:hypothetical protein